MKPSGQINFDSPGCAVTRAEGRVAQLRLAQAAMKLPRSLASRRLALREALEIAGLLQTLDPSEQESSKMPILGIADLYGLNKYDSVV